MGFRKFTQKQLDFYDKLKKNQTINFVRAKNEEYGILNRSKAYITDLLKALDDYVDPSDPDLTLSNSVHAYQTAEAIREKYPEDYAYQVCGLIHDLGKVLYQFGEPDWAVVGDTFVVGCPKKECGIKNLELTFGHDQYFYNILKLNKNGHYFPEKYWDIIRFHSFYDWHTFGLHTEYETFQDLELKRRIVEFNSFDLYSKSNEQINENIKDYYEKLLKQYFPNKLLL